MDRGRIPLTWQEFDAFGHWRKMLFWQPGELRKVKRGYNKRVRRLAKREVHDELIEN